MLPLASRFGDAVIGSGFIAASIAIGGFIGQVGPTLAREDERAVRSAATVGGLIGLGFALAITIAVNAW